MDRVGARLARTLVTFLLVAAPTACLAAPDDSPRCPAPEHRQFDFWVGEWNVETEAGGRFAGTNRIERILDGCALQENWVGSLGMRGTSINQYFEGDRRWHQLWVDTQGTRLELAGGMREGKMVLEGEAPGDSAGPPVLHRITWEPRADGTVRQHWQSSTDGGSTWRNVFAGIYRRTPAGKK